MSVAASGEHAVVSPKEGDKVTYAHEDQVSTKTESVFARSQLINVHHENLLLNVAPAATSTSFRGDA